MNVGLVSPLSFAPFPKGFGIRPAGDPVFINNIFNTASTGERGRGVLPELVGEFAGRAAVTVRALAEVFIDVDRVDYTGFVRVMI